MNFRKLISKTFSGGNEPPEKDIVDELTEQAERLALRKLFAEPRFNECDGLNEYAEGYNTFNARGDVIPVEMQQAMKRLQSMTDEQVMTAQSEVADQTVQSDIDPIA